MPDLDQTRFPRLSLRQIMPQLVPLVALAVSGGLFWHHLAALDGAALRAALSSVGPWQWAGALLFTALSFHALGSYDVLVHRVLGTGQPRGRARRAGIKAIAVSQTVGFGVVSSALVRWRCLPDLPAAACARLSVVVSLSFLAALAVLSALVVPVSGLVPQSAGFVLGGLLALVAPMVLARLAHRLGWIPAPVSLRTLGALMLATTLDTVFAAAALMVLWPEPVAFQMLFAAYLVALGAGLISNAPGGIGAFDLALLALLPAPDETAAMAGLLAFRAIYYALPAGLALFSLLRPPLPLAGTLPDHPEAGLARQDARALLLRGTPVLTLPTFGTDVVLGDLPAPLGLPDLRFGTNAPRVLYKTTTATACAARARGWAVLRCAEDAVLDPTLWAPTGPACRQLRRMLAQFGASGLHIRDVHDHRAMAPVARAWAASHGGERGLSMGRYCPAYLRHQRVFAAFDGPTPVAFVSFHTGAEWTLDLMRHRDGIAKGTMQALVVAGITAAREAGVTRLSLACVPAPAPHLPFAERALAGAAGLRRFKTAFAPKWEPRYICAAHWPALVAHCSVLALRIHAPPALAPAPQQRIHADHENYSVASISAPCDPQAVFAGASGHDHRPQPFGPTS